MIEQQKFNLLNPRIAVQAITSAIEEPIQGNIKIAKLLLAAEIAVKKQLSENQRSKLKSCLLQE